MTFQDTGIGLEQRPSVDEDFGPLPATLLGQNDITHCQLSDFLRGHRRMGQMHNQP